MARKKTAQKSNKSSGFTSLQSILSNERTDFIFGLCFVAVSIFFVISFVSFLRTGQADQSILENLRPSEWRNENNVFSNCCHSFGAIVSYYFITLNFGLPSFLIPIFMFIVGMKLMRIFDLNIWKWFFGLAIVLIWCSIAFAKFLAPIMRGEVYNPGGNHGLYCMQQLENLIGPPGLTVTLALTAIIFLTFLSSQTIIWIRKMLNPVKYLTSKVRLTVTNTMNVQEEPTYEEPLDDNDAVDSDEENSNNVENDEEQQSKHAPNAGITVIDLTENAVEKAPRGDENALSENTAPTINLAPSQPVKPANQQPKIGRAHV